MISLKYLLVSVAIIGLASCATTPSTVVYKPENIPVYVVPAPPKVAKPILTIKTLTPAQKTNIGELAKAFNISLTQEEQYACQLEDVISAYGQLAANPSSVITPALPVTESSKLTDFGKKLFNIIPSDTTTGKPATLAVNTDNCQAPTK